MIDIITVTSDNIKEVAKMTGRRERDLALDYEDAVASNRVLKICVSTPNIPEGFMRTN